MVRAIGWRAGRRGACAAGRLGAVPWPAAVLVALLVSCSGSAGEEVTGGHADAQATEDAAAQESTTSTAATTTSTPVESTVAPPAADVTVPALGTVCGPASPPVASAGKSYATVAAPLEGAPLHVERLWSVPPLTTDGPEITAVFEAGEPLDLPFPSGGVQVSSPGGGMVAASATDLDGDGVDEAWVAQLTDDRLSVDSAYVVWSATPPGQYELSAVGTRVPAGIVVGPARWSGADGPMLFVLRGIDPSMRTGDTIVVSIAEVVGAGPGGDVHDTAARGALPGIANAVVEDETGPVVVTSEVDPSTGELTVHAFDGETVRSFATTPAGASSTVGSSGSVDASRTDSTRLLRVLLTERGGNTWWTWDLDAPCASDG